jgi:hypothetical protein
MSGDKDKRDIAVLDMMDAMLTAIILQQSIVAELRDEVKKLRQSFDKVAAGVAGPLAVKGGAA